MADIIDVQNALQTLCVNAIYPNGTGSPSIINQDVYIFLGWPIKGSLDQLLRSGKVAVSIFPSPIEKPVTYKFIGQVQNPISPATLTAIANLDAQTVTIGGVPTAAETIMVIANDQPYTYTIQGGDTLATIASFIASQIEGATASGPVVTIPSAYRLNSYVNTSGTAVQQTKDQHRHFKITIWSPTPAFRDQVGGAIDANLSAIHRFVLPDNLYANLTYSGSLVIDNFEIDGLYRRDLDYMVQYSTTITLPYYTITNPLSVSHIQS
jgi:hypothetical protein